MRVRPREDSDLGALELVARAVRAANGYPVTMADDDFHGLLVSPDAIAAWVAVADDTIVGQVSLHSRSSPEVNAFITDQLGLSEHQLGFVARLIVDPSTQRMGIARALLRTAEQAAVSQGLTPILDVVDVFLPAIALYEQQGWKQMGTVRIDLSNGTTITERIYVSSAR